MRLYLVRWPGLKASLVSAQNEDDLLDVLDQADDPGGCNYQVYRGPVWIDFNLPFVIRDIAPAKTHGTELTDWTVEPSPEYCSLMTRWDLQAKVPVYDWSTMMLDDVVGIAFPNLHAWLEEHELDDPEEADDPFPAELRAALVADLGPLVRHEQALAALDARHDPAAEFMKSMHVSVMPPAWTPEEGRELMDTIVRLANVLAEKLGIPAARVLEALNTPDVRERLDELAEIWALSSVAEEDDQEDDEPGP